jgi:hypothetical protein
VTKHYSTCPYAPRSTITEKRLLQAKGIRSFNSVTQLLVGLTKRVFNRRGSSCDIYRNRGLQSSACIKRLETMLSAAALPYGLSLRQGTRSITALKTHGFCLNNTSLCVPARALTLSRIVFSVSFSGKMTSLDGRIPSSIAICMMSLGSPPWCCSTYAYRSGPFSSWILPCS